MAAQEEEQWPIYKLANYELGGRLLELSSHLQLLVEQQHEQQQHQRQQHQLHQAHLKQETGSWWWLVEQKEPEGQLERLYRARLIQLALALHRLVSSPYLTSGCGGGGGGRKKASSSLPLGPCSLEPEVSCRRMGLMGASAARASISETGDLRRLSWRRRWPAKRAPAATAATAAATTASWSPAAAAAAAGGKAKVLEGAGEGVLMGWLRQDRETCGLLTLSTGHQVTWSKRSECRGRYGESLVHILLVNQSHQHHLLLVLLLHLWPQLAADLFEARKLYGLTCLHLAIAHDNHQLLAYLLGLARALNPQLLEQQATGSLFRCPEQFAATESRPPKLADGSHHQRRRPPDNKSQVRPLAAAAGANGDKGYWCDSAPCWPAAHGHHHLLLFDRLLQNLAQMSPTSGGDQHQRRVVYLGASPLAWSMSLNKRALYEQLVAAGAHQDGQDSQGFTCLHLLAVNNQLGWSRFLSKSGASLEVEDGRGLTPMLLACRLGRHLLFEELLELSAAEFWSYSSVRCSGYPLDQLDTRMLPEDGQQQQQQRSALEEILESRESSNEQKAQLLSSNVVKKLLEEKWRIFARRLFYHELLVALLQLASLTLSISLRPPATNSSSNSNSNSNSPDNNKWVRHLAELATWLLAGHQLARFLREWSRFGQVSLQWTYNPMLPSHVTANGLILLWPCARLARLLLAPTRPEATYLAQAEDIIMIFAAPLAWSSLLFFIAAFRVTGPFVAMIRYMLVRDLRQFSLIYLIFLHAFAQCLFFVNQTKANDQEQQQQSGRPLQAYLSLWMELFKMTLGVYDLQPFRHSTLARLFFLLFIYLIPILFNMLIAMMNNTYSLIISQSERAWSFQWARTLFALERRLGDKQRVQHLRQYSINMPKPLPSGQAKLQADEKQQFVPAIMIIKRMDCTRAERRRRVASRWQRAIREVAQFS